MSAGRTGTLRPVEAGEADALAALQVASWADAYRGIFPDAYLDGPMAGGLGKAGRVVMTGDHDGRHVADVASQTVDHVQAAAIA